MLVSNIYGKGWNFKTDSKFQMSFAQILLIYLNFVQSSRLYQKPGIKVRNKINLRVLRSKDKVDSSLYFLCKHRHYEILNIGMHFKS